MERWKTRQGQAQTRRAGRDSRFSRSRNTITQVSVRATNLYCASKLGAH
jgi:hypothetical protein